MHLHCGSFVHVGSVEDSIDGTQLRTASNIDIPSRTKVVVPTNQINCQNTVREASVCEVYSNEILTEKNPNLVMLSVGHFQNEVDSIQILVTIVNLSNEWI